MTTFSEHMAIRSLELAAELRSARARIRDLERSRNLWKARASQGVVRERGLDAWRAKRKYQEAA